MSMAKNAAMNEIGKKIVVTVVNTVSVLPWREAPSVCSRAKRNE